jgi:hypothetical protein
MESLRLLIKSVRAGISDMGRAEIDLSQSFVDLIYRKLLAEIEPRWKTITSCYKS